MSKQYFAFISYASQRGEWVARLQRNLERCLEHYARASGEPVPRQIFLDQKDLRTGQSWLDQLQESLDASQRLILVISPETTESDWVRREWQGFLTQDDGKPIFPVVVEQADVPAFLRPEQYIDFSGLEGDAYLERLTQLFGDLLGRTRRDPPPMPTHLELFPKPQPSYSDDDSKQISQALDLAYQQRAQRLADGDDVSDLNTTIVDLKRRLRSGPQLQAGDFLLDGRFELLEAIGRGGFATVWKAYDRKGQTVVAVKVLHSQYTQDLGRRTRFFRGARQMASLRHPGIVRVVEPECEDDGYFFFVMEYVGGGDFRQAVLAGGLLVEEQLRVVLEVGKALTHSHKQGVIHRDVKPANILLDLDGRPKLTDFDLVRAADTTGGTRTAMMGTFLYAAPEAMADGKQAGEPADIYSLGMTAVFALYGEELPPDVLWELPELVQSLEMPAACRPVLLQATERQVEARWGSVEAFCGALEEGLAVRNPSPVLALAAPPPPVTLPEPVQVPNDPEGQETKQKKLSLVDMPRLWLVLILFGLVLVGIQVVVGYWLGKSGVEVPGLRFLPGEVSDDQGSEDSTASVELPTEQRPRVLEGVLEAPGQPSGAQSTDWSEDSETTAPADENVGMVETMSMPEHCAEAARKTGIELVAVPGGQYTLGADDVVDDNSKPIHTVTLTPFWIGKHPVTNQQYRRFVKAAGHREPKYWDDERFQLERQPVVGVDWNDAQAFVQWSGLRLPSEAQWEAAARGADQRRYPWGNTKPTAALADFGGGELDEIGNHPDGAGPFGAQDQAGGAWEWCQDDWSAEAYVDRDGQVDPVHRDSTSNVRVVRGGSWLGGSRDLPSAYRVWDWTEGRIRFVGFRVVCGSAPEPSPPSPLSRDGRGGARSDSDDIADGLD